MSLKLLDYGRLNPFREIFGKPRYLGWPVSVYRVTLPKASDDDAGLNQFERVILKLIDATGSDDAHVLADETCIPPDLVKGILLRLRDRELIDDDGNVNTQAIENSESEKSRDLSFITALLFRELGTGKVLPFLHLLDPRNPLLKKEGHEKLSRLIRSDKALKQSHPSPREVINAWRAMKRRFDSYGVDYKMPAIEQITISGMPEQYFFECPIAIQKSDGEFRIADPFGTGFSLILEMAFENLLEQDEELAEWLQKWKQSLSNTHNLNLGDSDQRSKELFDSQINWQRYPNLVASLRPAKNDRFRSIAKIHASLEWALFYACSRRPFEDPIAILKLNKQTEHGALLENAARSIGLDLWKHKFRPIRDGKILDFQNGQAELETVIAIAILQAQQDNSHPLHRIAASQPNIIRNLFDIKKKRDEKSHGKGSAGTSESELSDDALMREFVHSLLPDICFADTTVGNEEFRDSQADILLDARTSIQNEFGFKVFNRLGTNLQNRLIHAERFWLSCNDDYDDARSFTDDLYAAIQSALENRLGGILPPNVGDSEFVSAAERKASAAGFADSLPECLKTVKVSAIRQTLQGAGQTLGACVIAFLLMSEEDILRLIADSQPSFIDDIADINVKRRHGNEQVTLPKADIKKLRKAAYTTIKTLLET